MIGRLNLMVLKAKMFAKGFNSFYQLGQIHNQYISEFTFSSLIKFKILKIVANWSQTYILSSLFTYKTNLIFR